LEDLDIPWWYWLITVAFAVVGTAAFLAARSEKEDVALLVGCGTLFSTISVLGVLWPVLRTREIQGVRIVASPSRRLPHRGVLIPTSNVKNLIALIGGTALGMGALLAALFSDNTEHRVKGALAFAVYLGVFLTFLRATVARRQGIMLTDEGLVWNDQMFGTGLISWSEIAEVRCYIHRERYSSPPSIGLRLKQLGNVNLSSQTNRKLTENVRRWGWHCYYHAETLVVPLPAIEKTINFYKDNPGARWELATGTAVDRIAGFESLETTCH
jgi:hypothetical protein